MKSFLIHKFGGPDVLTMSDTIVPQPKKNELLIKVCSASINPRDWLVREGRYQFKHFLGGMPITLGSDFSGEVVDVGRGADEFEIGDAVFGQSLRMGAFAEYIVVNKSIVARKPAAISHCDAAAIPCAGQTAFQALLGVKPNSKVLVNGAGGGVGSYAIQLAKVKGCEVTAVASKRSEEFCLSLGADRFIDRKLEDFSSIAREQNLIFDAVGRSSFARSRQAMAPNGVYVTTIPSLASASSSISTWAMSGFGMIKRQRVKLVFARNSISQLEQISKWIESGNIQSPVTQQFEFVDLPKALKLSASWQTQGKITVTLEA